jgi:tetratricopeptide (TPR) repeat protein
MDKILKSIFFLFAFSASFYSYGQIRTDVSKSELDSLINLIPTFKDQELVDHYNLIAASISQRYPDSCFYYANEAFALSEYLDYDFGRAVAVFNMGNGYFYKIDVKNAMSNYLAAIKIFDHLPISQEYGNMLLQIASLNRYLENDSKAIELYKEAIRIFDSLGNNLSAIVAKYKIGYSFIRSAQYDSAFVYLHKALYECKKIGHPKHLAIIYDYIGITYEWRDDEIPFEERRGGWEAIPYLDTCYYYAKLSGFKLYEEISLSNIGECYHHYIYPPDYKKAEKYYLKSIELANSISTTYRNKASTLAWLGELYADIGQFEKSKYYLNLAMEDLDQYDSRRVSNYVSFSFDRIYTDLNYSWWTKNFIYTGYKKLYQYLGEYDKAIEYAELRHMMLDSMRQINTRNQIDYLIATEENMRTNQKMQILQKETELQQFQDKRSINVLIVLVLVSVITGIILLLYFRNLGLKTDKEKSTLQQRLFRSQMNPHFIFNSLASIQNSIINEDPEKASKYLARFSKLVRNILVSSVEEFCTLEEEIATIENYLELQKIRFPDKFDFTIVVDPGIDQDIIRIPTMLAQPFIENAIEHGIQHKSGKGNIDIKFSRHHNIVKLEIVDDGVGRKKAGEILKQQQPEHHSLAIKITLQRLEILNKKRKQNIKLLITDLEDKNGSPAGTKATFDIPILH